MKLLKTGRNGDKAFSQLNGTGSLIFLSGVKAHPDTLGGVIYSEDGTIYKELYITYVTGRPPEEAIFAYEPRSGRLLRIALIPKSQVLNGIIYECQPDTIIVDGITFKSEETPNAVECVELPAQFELPILSPNAYAHKHTDGRIFVFPLPEKFVLDAFVSFGDDKYFSTFQIYDYRSNTYSSGYLLNAELKYDQPYMVSREAMVLGGEKIGYEMSEEYIREYPYIIVENRYFGLFQDFSSHATNRSVDSINGLPLFIVDTALILGGEKLTSTECPGSISLTRFEDIFMPSFLFETSDGDLLFVSTSKYRYSVNSTRFYIVSNGKGTEVQVITSCSWRCLGNEEIVTAAGRFFFTPEGSDTKERTNFNGQPIKQLDMSQFSIMETWDSLEIIAIKK